LQFSQFLFFQTRNAHVQTRRRGTSGTSGSGAADVPVTTTTVADDSKRKSGDNAKSPPPCGDGLACGWLD
jgi:hypothetical protein